MMHKRLGCLSGAGFLAAGVTLSLVLIAWLVGGGRMFSPGPLRAQTGESLAGVRSHAETGGRCAACHPAPWSRETLADRCLACHDSVAAELSNAGSLHGALMGTAPRLDCRDCHTEHRGPDAQLTLLDASNFPHTAAGYALTGHAQTADGRAFTCAECHTSGISEFDIGACVGCHRQIDAPYIDAHVADFGAAACLDCHDGVDRYSRDRFDHAALAFPLTGAHHAVACQECHAGAASVADLQATPQACAGCHAEPDYHRSLFSAACADCHSTTEWRPATYAEPHSFPFDHGEEGVSPCQTCHTQSLAEYTCYGCHEHTPANIEEEHREEEITDITDCVHCHLTGRKEEAED